jgi:hypothetical protein
MGKDPIKAAISSSRALIDKSYELLRSTSHAGVRRFPQRPHDNIPDSVLPQSNDRKAKLPKQPDG